MVVTILATVAVLALLIFIHELGHFLAARAFDIRVPRFSIGLGPKLFSFTRGETEYRISAFPLGGYVKVAGMKEMSTLEGGDDDEDHTEAHRTFESKPPAARAVVLAAGVAMNALLAVVLFAAVAWIWGVPVPPEPVVGDVVEEWLPEGAASLAEIEPGARVVRVGGRPVPDLDQAARAISRARPGPLTVEFADRPPITIEVPPSARDRRLLPLALDPVRASPPVIGGVTREGAAAAAGLASGDRVLAVDGRPVATWQEMVRMVERSPDVSLRLDVERTDGTLEALEITPAPVSTGAGTVGRIGASRSRAFDPPRERDRRPPLAAVAYGFTESRDIVVAVGEFVVGLFDGRHSARELGGPVLIGQLSGMAARAGLATLLTFVALLSINLAVLNLLPIPALDGGHLVILAVETVRGKPVPDRARMTLGRLGTAFVVILMIWAVASDVLRLFGI